MLLIWIFVMALGFADSRYTANRSGKWIQSFSVPWVGVLSHKESFVHPPYIGEITPLHSCVPTTRAGYDEDSRIYTQCSSVSQKERSQFSLEALTGITLIKTKLGLSNAYDVARITKTNIRNTTKAMFLAVEGEVRYAAVTDYVTHPEFNEDTLNTIALVFLDYDEKIFDWELMVWPKEDEQMNHHLGNIYAFGYADDHGVLEQVMHSMEFVDLGECNNFYKQGDLNRQWITPTEYQCFRKKFSSEKCVFEAGMTLAVHHLRRWKLLGLSVLGPGCSLPARFIDFARYVTWVRQQTSLWALNVGQQHDTLVSGFIRRRNIYHM